MKSNRWCRSHHRRHHHQPFAPCEEGGDYLALLKRICDIVQGPTSAEVVATDLDGMLREGRELAKIDKHIVVKVPFTKAGVAACKAWPPKGPEINVTLIFSATQALLAAKVGATYVSPSSAGSTTSPLRHGPDHDIVQIFDNYDYTPPRSSSLPPPVGPMHIVEAARMGRISAPARHR